MSQSVKYVGLDVHKDTIAVAVAEDGKRAEVREHKHEIKVMPFKGKPADSRTAI